MGAHTPPAPHPRPNRRNHLRALHRQHPRKMERNIRRRPRTQPQRRRRRTSTPERRPEMSARPALDSATHALRQLTGAYGDQDSGQAICTSIDNESLARTIHAWDVEGGPCEGPYEDLTDTQKATWESAARAVKQHLTGDPQ